MGNPFDKFDKVNPFDRFDNPAEPRQSILDHVFEKPRALVGGIQRGVKDVFDTGADYLSKLGGAEENARIKAMNEAGKADFESKYGDSTTASVGRFGGNVLSTMPAGGVLGNLAMLGVKAAPKIAPMIANSLTTGGMRLGAPTAPALSLEGIRNASIRIGGGATGGGVMAGLVNPDDVGMGTVIGAGIPVAGKALGETGKAFMNSIGNPLFRPSTSAINSIVRDAGGEDAARAAIERAVGAGKTLSGEQYTLGQAGKNWGLAATERARSAINPENYQRIYTAQRDARIAAMQRMAGGADEATRKDALDNLIANRNDSVSDLYTGMQDKPFMLGKEGENLMTRARPYGALLHAQKIAATQGRPFSIPVTEQVPTKGMTLADIEAQNSMRPTMPDVDLGSAPVEILEDPSKGLLSEIRRLGGISMKEAKDLFGENQITKMGVQGGVFTKKGEGLDEMASRLVESGHMNPTVLDDVDGGAQSLRDEIQRLSGGGEKDAASQLKKAADDYYGEAPILPGLFKPGVPAITPTIPNEVTGRIVKGGDLQSVKEGIDQVISKAEGPQMRAMMQLKNDYLSFMETKSPEYIKANNIFADKSKPITQMTVAQRMLDTLTGEAAKHGGEAKQAPLQFLQAYKNIPLAARSVSGMKQQPAQVFTPENLGTVRQIAREISKHQDLQNLGRGTGSDTAQKMARSNMLTVVRDTIKASPRAMAALNLASTGAKGRIDSRIDLLMQNPDLASKALAELSKPQRSRLAELLANPAVRAGLTTQNQ